MNISNEIVEAAAKAEYEYETGGDWAHLHEDDRDAWRGNAKIYLDAVAPLIAARALRDAASGSLECPDDTLVLQALADELEGNP